MLSSSRVKHYATFLRNGGNHSHDDRASQNLPPDSTAATLRGPQNSPNNLFILLYNFFLFCLSVKEMAKE